MKRRDFLTLSLAGAMLGGVSCVPQARSPVRLVSACDNTKGEHFIAGLNEHGDIRYKMPIAQRGHGTAVNPVHRNEAVYFSRRPGTLLHHVDMARGRIVSVTPSEPERHFVGHGDFTPDGRYLVTPENHYEKGVGIITVRDARTLAVLHEVPSHGVGPHEAKIMPDGHTVAVANGGILTHPSRHREKLNLETMQPSLAYVDMRNGDLMSEHRLPDHQQSIRHFDINDDGQVTFGVQYEGAPDHRVPLVYTHRMGETDPQPMTRYEWLQLTQYTGSVTYARSHPLVAVSSPRGHRLTLWNTETHLPVREFVMRDVCGVAWNNDHQAFMVTTGTGQLYRLPIASLAMQRIVTHHNTKWDNHLVSV